MGLIHDRITGTIEQWRTLWGQALKDFLMQALEKGVVSFLETMEPAAQDQIRESLTTIKDNPNTPEPIRNLIDNTLAPGQFLPALIVVPLAILLLLPMVLGLSQPLSRLIMYPQDKVLKSYRLDPQSVITAWRRDNETYAGLFDDLRDQGWSDERLEALKFYTLFYPPAADMIRFADFGAFDPTVIAKWREFYDAPGWIKEPMSLIGINEEWANRYWFSHWRQPGRFELGELHRREEIDDDTVKMAYLTQGFSSFWQDKLLELVKEVPTRVDVRRFWDMGTIDEVRLRQIYHAQGYYDQDLEDYVLWTKVYVAFPDLIARWRNGWLSEDEVRSELTGLGMPAERVDEMIQTKVKSTQAERTVTERSRTKADIIKGVKTGVITRGEAIELLTELGYDEDEADFILDVNIPRDEEDIVIKQRELTKADIIKGLKAEIITEALALARLIELRYIPADAEFLLKIFKATITPPAETRDREASKADIIQAVKKGLITPEDGYLMLQDIGFSAEAAQFVLTVRAETSPFSPANFAEFRERTHKLRVASGLEGKPMTEELKQASEAVIRLTGEVNRLREAIEANESQLADLETWPVEAQAKRDELQISLHQAEAELERTRADYDRLLAAWRHGSSP